MERTPSSEEQENHRIVAQLHACLAEGYLLHGSKQKLEVLEPRQSSDDNPLRTTGKAHAIYAEAHDVRIPILMALFAQKDLGKRGWKSGYNGHGPDSELRISGENCTFTDGYIYVLPPDSFIKEGSDDDFEFISPVAVTPIAVIKISPSILSVLDNIQNNIEP